MIEEVVVTGTLIYGTASNSVSCYFTSVFCESTVSYRSIFVLHSRADATFESEVGSNIRGSYFTHCARAIKACTAFRLGAIILLSPGAVSKTGSKCRIGHLRNQDGTEMNIRFGLGVARKCFNSTTSEVDILLVAGKRSLRDIAEKEAAYKILRNYGAKRPINEQEILRLIELDDLSECDSDEGGEFASHISTPSDSYLTLPDDVLVEKRLEEIFGIDNELHEDSPPDTGYDNEGSLYDDLQPIFSEIDQLDDQFPSSTPEQSTTPLQSSSTVQSSILASRPSTSHDIVFQRNARSTNNNAKPRSWKMLRKVPKIPNFDKKITCNSDYTHKTQPVEMFDNFFPVYIVNNIVEQTNLYAHQNNCKNWTDVTSSEIRAYLGVLIMMGLNPLPDVELYWSSDPFYNNSEMTKAFPIVRFKKISENLHLNDNEKYQLESPKISTNCIKSGPLSIV
ncbi:PiggyBac transposable element-derived protein 2 [Eumeta japonica]|uniref:PiggyBac transposable element-derived protein 2 n=1 Tax=Eumeta variegata TaxID=151549 RepID=A0A4C1VJX1_EUMVA|nr:PiggyBac transposable element-derived protein 2 [Eumeta japonica]